VATRVTEHTYYDEELTMKEIGNTPPVFESRVSQMGGRHARRIAHDGLGPVPHSRKGFLDTMQTALVSLGVFYVLGLVVGEAARRIGEKNAKNDPVERFSPDHKPGVVNSVRKSGQENELCRSLWRGETACRRGASCH
jgi:hypothetical protein